MALAVRLDTMRTLVRQRANMENATGFIPDAEINSQINYGLNELYDQLVGKQAGRDYYRATTNISTVSGTSLYSLPASFYQLISVDVNVGGALLPMDQFSEEERDDYAGYPALTPMTGNPFAYQLQGQNIRFIPVPAGVYVIGVNFIPSFSPLLTDASTFDGISGWEEKAVWNAVAYCLAKEESDPSFALLQVANLEKRINALANARDRNRPARVADVRRVTYGRSYGRFR